VWSRNGRRIAFYGGDSADARQFGNGQHLYVVDASGKNLKQVVANATHIGNLSFSPDGTRLLYDDRRNENKDIYVLTLADLVEHRLTTQPGTDEGPSWSPDGAYILFQSNSNPGGGMGSHVFVMKADGSSLRQVR
jgi:Tol biopolymer transport system component